MDHSYKATKEQRSRNENSWKLSLNAEGANGPLDQRDDFKDAKETCKRLYHEHTAIDGCGNTPIPPQQQVRQRPNQQFEGHEEYSNRPDPSGWKYYITAAMHSCSSPASWWQPSDSWWSTWNWDSSSWSEQLFFEKKFQMRHFVCQKFNLLAIDGWCNKYICRAHVFLMRISTACLSQLVVTVVLQVQSSRHALISRARVAQAHHEALRIVSCSKSSHLIAQCHSSHLT